MLERHYPDRLMASPEFSQFQAAADNQVVALHAAVTDFGKQLNVSTATYGLGAWEKALGIPTDVSNSDTQRRERIMSKLRGSGTVTAEMIANVARSFTGGEVTVIEVPEEYKFILKFSGQYGVPPHMDDVGAAVDEIKPAHLDFEYEYSYLLIRDIHEVMKITELETMVLNKFAGGSQ